MTPRGRSARSAGWIVLPLAVCPLPPLLLLLPPPLTQSPHSLATTVQRWRRTISSRLRQRRGRSRRTAPSAPRRRQQRSILRLWGPPPPFALEIGPARAVSLRTLPRAQAAKSARRPDRLLRERRFPVPPKKYCQGIGRVSAVFTTLLGGSGAVNAIKFDQWVPPSPCSKKRKRPLSTSEVGITW